MKRIFQAKMEILAGHTLARLRDSRDKFFGFLFFFFNFWSSMPFKVIILAIRFTPLATNIFWALFQNHLNLALNLVLKI